MEILVFQFVKAKIRSEIAGLYDTTNAPYDLRRDDCIIRQWSAKLVVFLVVVNTNNEICYYIAMHI